MFVFRLINIEPSTDPNNILYYIHFGVLFNGFTDISRTNKLITYLNKKDDILEMNASGIFYVDVDVDSNLGVHSYYIIKNQYDLETPVKQDILNDNQQYLAVSRIVSDDFIKLVSNLAFTNIENYTYQLTVQNSNTSNNNQSINYSINQIDFLCSQNRPYLPSQNKRRVLFGKLYNMYSITDSGQYVVNRSKAYGLFCIPPYSVRFDFLSVSTVGNQLNITSDYTITLSGGNHYTHLLIVVSGANISIIQSTTINSIDTKNKIGIEENIPPVSYGHLSNAYDNKVSVIENISTTENINSFFGL